MALGSSIPHDGAAVWSDAGITDHAANHFANATVNYPWLIGIAIVLTNLAGLWQLPGKAQEHEARAKAREERKYWEDAAKRRKEESRCSKRRIRRQEAFEQDMRRVFGR